MKVFFTSCLIAVLTLLSHAQTQQWGEVYFDNSVLPSPPDRLVRVWESGMIPLVGTNFIAELFYRTSAGNWVLLTNGSARFRPQGTLYPGTWSGGMRTLVGVPPGTPTEMRVLLWNNDAAGSVHEAIQKVLILHTF